MPQCKEREDVADDNMDRNFSIVTHFINILVGAVGDIM